MAASKMPSFNNRHAKRGRLMMLLLFHDVNIGFPLLLVLEAFYKQCHKSLCSYLLSFLNQLILLTFLFLLILTLTKYYLNVSPKSEIVVSLYSYHSTNKVSSSNVSLRVFENHVRLGTTSNV